MVHIQILDTYHSSILSRGLFQWSLHATRTFFLLKNFFKLKKHFQKLLCLHKLMIFARRDGWSRSLPQGAPRPMIFKRKRIGVIIELLNLWITKKQPVI